jgi:hypothetical protein
LFVARDTQANYAGQITTICKRAYEPLKTASGNYFENVVTISTLKHDGLVRLEPPAERASFHRQFISRERQMTADAIVARNRVAQAMAVGGYRAVDPVEFPTLRAAQAELDGLYRSVGVAHCSN